MPAEGTMGRPDPREPRAALAALVFAGGDPPDPAGLAPTVGGDLVIAADSGLAHARALGVHVDLVVGDLDSVDPATLDAAVADGTAVERHPTAKDATDLELALDAALDRGATSVHVVGVGGGRLDHFLGNVLLLASPRYATARVDAHVGGAHVTVVHDHVELDGTPGGLCSLLPLGGPAVGVLTDGLRFPLRRETLPPGTTRGVSNEFLGARATVSLESGVLLAVLPSPGLPSPGKDA
jgi:thiamine pyrophosphokinase